jgi:hypothetical protein
MRHAGIAEYRASIDAFTIEARKNGRGCRPVKTTIMKAKTDLDILQKILTSGKRTEKLTPIKPFKMAAPFMIVKM